MYSATAERPRPKTHPSADRFQYHARYTASNTRAGWGLGTRLPRDVYRNSVYLQWRRRPGWWRSHGLSPPAGHAPNYSPGEKEREKETVKLHSEVFVQVPVTFALWVMSWEALNCATTAFNTCVKRIDNVIVNQPQTIFYIEGGKTMK